MLYQKVKKLEAGFKILEAQEKDGITEITDVDLKEISLLDKD